MIMKCLVTNPQEYFTFDAHLQWFAMGQGAQAYIPMKHYGEHGGFPNPEHMARGKIARAGVHRADNLKAPLHFLPAYARNSRINFALVRVGARARGWARLFSGRWIVKTDVYKIPLSTRLRMYLIGIWRLSELLTCEWKQRPGAPLMHSPQQYAHRCRRSCLACRLACEQQTGLPRSAHSALVASCRARSDHATSYYL